MIDTSVIRERFTAVERDLNERSRRLLAAAEAKTAGYGGITAAHRATGIEGTCIKHRFGKSSIKERSSSASCGSAPLKMYGKSGIVLRIETTTNDVSSFKHYRKVSTTPAASASW